MEENPRTAVFLLIFSSSPAGTGQQCPHRAQGVCEAGSKGSPQHWGSFRLKLGETGTTTKTTQQILGSQSLQPGAHRVHPKWRSKSHGHPTRPAEPKAQDDPTQVFPTPERPLRAGVGAPTTDPTQHSLRAASLQSASSTPQKKLLGTVWDQVYIFIF